MNVASFISDPTHESPDVIDQRSPTDPTLQQTGGTVPISVQPGEALPIIDPTIGAGFAPVFAGWNVWDLWYSQDPIEGIGGWIADAGLSLERQLRTWVEDQLTDNAPGVSVADPLNPAALKGDQVQILPSANGLPFAITRATVPSLAGELQLGTEGSQATKTTVRFFNRGERTVMPWPHDENVVLDVVYQPSKANTITNSAAPSSLGGTASDIAGAINHGLETLAWVAGGVGALWLLSKLAGRSK